MSLPNFSAATKRRESSRLAAVVVTLVLAGCGSTLVAQRNDSVAEPPVTPAMRKAAKPLFREPVQRAPVGDNAWFAIDIPSGRHRLIGFDGTRWEWVDHAPIQGNVGVSAKVVFFLPSRFLQVELIPAPDDDGRAARRIPG